MLDPSNPMFAMLSKMMGGGLSGAPQLAGQQSAIQPPGGTPPYAPSLAPAQMQSANPGGGGYHFAPPPQPAPQQDPMGGMGGAMSSMLPMLAAMGGGGGGGGSTSPGLMGLLGMAQKPTQDLSLGGGNGLSPMQSTLSGQLPNIGGSQTGLSGGIARMMDGGGQNNGHHAQPPSGTTPPDILSMIMQGYGFLRNLGGGADGGGI
jgi:hypothetical protein